MSDLKDRVGTQTGGNANLIADRGVQIAGDGEQTVYLRANPNGPDDGKVLTVDSSAETGFSFQPGGGGGPTLTNKGDLLTSDGVTEVVLPVGADGDVLTADSTAPDGIKWAPGGGGGSGAQGMFYGLTAGTGNGGPTDYAATVAVKTSVGTGRVPFPRDGSVLTGVSRVDGSSFTIAAIGVYKFDYKVHTTEPGQLAVELNGAEVALSETADMNPTSGGHLLVGSCLITTTTVNSVVAIVNPPGNSTALTITPADGANTHANAQSLTITQNGAGGGGGSVTGSDGVTVTANNATNDLVTGTNVQQISGKAVGSGGGIHFENFDSGSSINIVQDNLNSPAALNFNSDGSVDLTTGDAGGGLNSLAFSSGDFDITSAGSLAANVANVVDIQCGGPGQSRILMGATGAVSLSSHSNAAVIGISPGTNQVNLLTSADINGNANNVVITSTLDQTLNIGRDLQLTTGRNVNITAHGSTGVQMVADHATGRVFIAAVNDNVTINAGAGDASGTVILQEGATVADTNRKFQIFNGVGFGQWPNVPDATGGSVIDVEARAALNAVLNALETWGWIQAAG
jgi:hypothetical protein